MKLSAIILAAGASSRFDGGHKLLVEINGLPIMRRVAHEISAADVGDIVVVAGDNESEIRAALGEGGWRIVVNPRPADGLSSSLRVGIEAINADGDGALIALADMPGIDAALISKLVEAFTESGGAAIVFPLAADGRRGHPVIWPRELFPPLKALSGDIGGKAIIEAHRELWRPVKTDDAGAFFDIDTRADLATFTGGKE